MHFGEEFPAHLASQGPSISTGSQEPKAEGGWCCCLHWGLCCPESAAIILLPTSSSELDSSLSWAVVPSLVILFSQCPAPQGPTSQHFCMGGHDAKFPSEFPPPHMLHGAHVPGSGREPVGRGKRCLSLIFSFSSRCILIFSSKTLRRLVGYTGRSKQRLRVMPVISEPQEIQTIDWTLSTDSRACDYRAQMRLDPRGL